MKEETETNQLKAGLTHEDIYTRFADRFKEIAQESMSEIIGEYLPHAESDLDSNVYYRAMDYISGQFGEHTFYGSAGKRFRQYIFEENQELIVAQLNQDNLDKIAELEEEIADLKIHLWNRR